METKFDEDLFEDMLPLYYKRLFPFDPYYRWLSYGREDEYFQRREFSFTMVDDIYLRFRSFKDLNDLQNNIFNDKPFKIDIGAVYSLSPKEFKNSPAFVAREKELVFDIDMTDYDDIRTCCNGADICDKCWKFMTLACKILDAALREDFGFKHLLWVFSGRRGIHCWVCDANARTLRDKARSSVAEYLQLVTGGSFQLKKVSICGDNIHDSITRALEVISKEFVSMCMEDQDVLGSKKGLMQFLGCIVDDSLKLQVSKELEKHTTSVDRWNAFVNYIEGLKEKGILKKRNQNLINEIMIQYTYPRLDINVSKGVGHLLKSPFCVHPKTGKVCVPFNPRAVEKFNPMTVPTISTLLKEVNAHDEKNDVKNIKDYKKTSLHKCVVIFEQFVRSLEETFPNKKLDQPVEF